jgi:hypothetical protein
MTRIDVYKYSKDREIIKNHRWQKTYRYIRIGSKFYRDDLMEINILEESNQHDNDFTINGKISLFQKFTFRIRLVLKLLRQTK